MTGIPMYQGNPAPQQGAPTGAFGVPLGPDGRPQVFQQPGQMSQQPQQPPQQFNVPPAQVVQEQRHSFPTSQLPQPQPVPQGYPQQPAGYPQQPQAPQGFQPPAPQQPAGIADQTVLNGPSVPPELQGRTWAEAKQIYAGLRDVVLRNANAGAQPQALTQPQVPLHSPAPAPGTPNAQPGQAPGSQDFWRDPAGAIDRAIEQRLSSALAPVVQRTHLDAAQAAMTTVAAEFPDFQAYAPAVIASLNGADPRMLGNAEMWRTAYWVTKGRAGAFQQPQPQAPAQQPLVQSPLAPQGYFPPQQAFPGQQPVPNMNTFFTEQPGRQGPSQQGVQLSDAQRFAAAKMGMSDADYAAWSGGMGRQIPGAPQGGR